MGGDEIGSGFHPDHAENRHRESRYAGIQEGQRADVAEQTAMVFRVMLLVGRRKAGRLGHQDEAQQQPYRPARPSLPLKRHFHYKYSAAGGTVRETLPAGV